MIACDTNIYVHAYNSASEFHSKAKIFIRSHAKNRQFAVCELVLVELYVLLRNPVVVIEPLSGKEAVAVCRQYRRNRYWTVVDYPGNLMNEIWDFCHQKDFGRRLIFDARLALTLRYHGVTEFATRNVKHFQNFGFDRVWDPLM